MSRHRNPGQHDQNIVCEIEEVLKEDYIWQTLET